MQVGMGAESGHDVAGGDPNSIDRSPWAWWRRQMPVSGRWAYLDHAAVAPLSGPAQEAVAHFIRQASELGDTVWPNWAATADRLRRSAARLLSADASEICLVPNTSTGINLVAEGLSWQPGDNVVVPEGEFPSNLFPWLNQQSRGVEVRIVPRRDGRVLTEDLMERVDARTRVVAVSWVGYASGYRLDVGELVRQAHRRGVPVFLDAIQGLGVFPLNLSEVPVDFLAADGHKWLLGPEGIGVAMIRREHLSQLRCGNVGWASVKNAFNYGDPEFQLRDDAARFESGSANLMGVAALAASLDLFLQIIDRHGPEAIENRILSLVAQLDEMLGRVGAKTRLPEDADRRSGILTFELEGVEPARIRKACLEQQVVVSCRGGGVRASIHAYNDADDLGRLVSVVESFT